jgi:hypothetical protein
MKNVILFASIVLASGLLFTNIYNSMVDVKSWGSNIPQSLETTRQYFKAANPGSFYRLFSPVNQVLALIAVILFWKTSPQAKWYLVSAFVLYVLGDVFTFAYFYPRNAILFEGSLNNVDILKKAWTEWSTMNWFRSLLPLAGLVCTFLAMRKIYHFK